METEKLTLTTTRYKGTAVSQTLDGDYIGNVYASGYPEYYRVRLAFTPVRTLKEITLQLTYSGNNYPTAVTYRRKVTTSATACPENASTEGAAFTWTDKAATLTISYTFKAGTTYYIWLWSPDAALGYVVLKSYSAEGTVGAPTLYVKGSGGWVRCVELSVKTSAGWVTCPTLHAKTASGWQET